MRTHFSDRVSYCDSANRRLLWRAAIKRATAQEKPRKASWLEAALRFMRALCGE
jgi:hypothetical protein